MAAYRLARREPRKRATALLQTLEIEWLFQHACA
jgi:hypothetical protein